jgi:molybdate transport system regulatory protein
MSRFVARSKVWLEIDGQPFLGDGRFRLLQEVDRTGSISAAARSLGLSYRKVWTQLQAMEETAPFPVLERCTGGKGGGTSQLTPEISALLERYARLREQARLETDRCFTELFG